MDTIVNEKLLEALRREPDKISPSIPEVREKARREAEIGSDAIRDREISRLLREERKRIRRKEAITPKYTGLNVTDGCRIGRRDAKTMPSKYVLRVNTAQSEFGRISKQNPVGKGEQAGYNPQFRDFWKARIKTQQKKGQGYKKVEVTKAEAVQEKNLGNYLVNNPSFNPAKAKRNAELRAMGKR